MGDVYIDFTAMKEDYKIGSSRIRMIDKEKFTLSIHEDSIQHLNYAKYSRAKKQKLLTNLNTIIAKNLLLIAIHDQEAHLGFGQANVFTEDVCLENRELSFR